MTRSRAAKAGGIGAAIAYAALAAGALSYFVSLQMGWRPPRLAPWDVAGQLTQELVSGALALSACVGVAASILEESRAWLRDLVRAGIVYAGGLAVLLALNLSRESTLAGAGRAIGLALAGGFGLSGLTAMLGGGRDSQSEALMPIGRRHAWVIGTLITLLAIGFGEAATPRQRHDGRHTVAARFDTESGWLQVESYEPPLLGEKVGIIAVSDRGQTNSVALMSDEWPRLVGLVSRGSSSGAAIVQVVGDINDAAPGDPTTLTLRTGAGLQFELASPRGARVTHQIAPADIPRLRAALEKVAADF